MSPPCIFCAIVAGEAPAHRVAETEGALAFMDIFPVAAGHTLVIPKLHAADLFEIDEGAVQAVAALARRTAHALRALYEPDGMAVYQANGRAAGQTVFHYHVHLIPRAAGAALKLHGARQGKGERLAEVAKMIAGHLE